MADEFVTWFWFDRKWNDMKWFMIIWYMALIGHMTCDTTQHVKYQLSYLNRQALCMCSPNNVQWHDVMMYWYLVSFFLRPIDFPNNLLIFRAGWMKQNSVARRLNLEDREVFLNNYVFAKLQIEMRSFSLSQNGPQVKESSHAIHVIKWHKCNCLLDLCVSSLTVSWIPVVFTIFRTPPLGFEL